MAFSTVHISSQLCSVLFYVAAVNVDTYCTYISIIKKENIFTRVLQQNKIYEFACI